MGSSSSRLNILETASKLFQVQGYHATGLNQIIKESGSPKGSIYYHFPEGKEQIALEAVEYTGKIVRKQLNKTLTASADPIEALQSVVQHLVDHLGHPEDVEGVPIGLIALETCSMSEKLRKACSDAFTSWQRLFADKLIENGFKQDRARELGILLQCTLEGALTVSVTQDNSEPLRILKEQIPLIIKP
ncbi:TetR/AcrR family transcriptional regulator [Salipaludibacillus sp. CF4.18]|uniref:TetR/AcrR family transcriptional regulator n=1 Tax=Salipaludibacillus sp. CF4.18 TaxID=3373081 RepID=UPI003EE5A4A1